jgi:hypothetical protein
VPYKNIADARKRDRRYWLKTRAEGPKPQQLPIGVVKDLGIKVPKDGLKIAVIPDVQAMPGAPMEHLTWCGKYLADKQPDVIVCIGDFGDFPSLSHFDRGTLQFEGRRYKKDLAAFHQAMALLMNRLDNARGWKPHLEFITGNHEDHIRRAVNEDPKLEGLMSTDDLRLADYGWRVHEFLQPVSIGGVAFCHYFPSGVMGRPITTAQALLTKLHMSAFAGHQQGRQIAYGKRADGADMTAIISGSFYQHSYEYLSPFTNRHWRGFYVLHEVRDGQFDEMAVSIDFLKRRYGA